MQLRASRFEQPEVQLRTRLVHTTKTLVCVNPRTPQARRAGGFLGLEAGPYLWFSWVYLEAEKFNSRGTITFPTELMSAAYVEEWWHA